MSAPTGEKVPRMAPKANADGPEEANTTFATGGLRLPLELYKKNKAKRHLFGCLFFMSKKTKGVEPRSERAGRRKGAKDGTE